MQTRTREEQREPEAPDAGEWVVVSVDRFDDLVVDRLEAGRVYDLVTTWWRRWGWVTVTTRDGELVTVRARDIRGLAESTRGGRRSQRAFQKVQREEYKHDCPRRWGDDDDE